ncbi:dihydropteroate synthase [Glaciihabitans sp. dw_435]|uniref:dihydropteroate synthase n=1 Tax=Glaciihabitans sp. dw_435 TaxID=2720081 RepID=UPI001BD1C96C|nr:dihydropteroate synthase [Glaciihabitans sp. dw_435]
MSSPLIFGILNVTPDSFSDGGRWTDASSAVTRGTELTDQGADVIDVGGESTRPGATRVPVEVEIQRVLPVVRQLVNRGIRVSVDTMNSETARLTAEAGAEFINDVSGGLADPEMYRTIAATGVSYIASHWRGHLDGSQDNSHYTDVVKDVTREVAERVAELIVWGIPEDKIIVDPGLGFAKNADDNWQVLGALGEFESLGFPVLIGASRKRFLADLATDGSNAAARDPATAIVSALAAQAGAWGVRVHDVPSTRLALDVWDRWNISAERKQRA